MLPLKLSFDITAQSSPGPNGAGSVCGENHAQILFISSFSETADTEAEISDV
jgi:hypothetical protein